jgi:formate dehydrogenase subunit gamma
VHARRSEWSPEAGQRLLDSLGEDERLILPALQSLQLEFGFVHPDAVPAVARLLNVSVADTYGVLTFYGDLRTTPPAPVTVSVCVAEACQSVGSRSLIDAVAGAFAAPGGRSADGVVDVAEVFCLGNCALGPSVLVNERLVGRVDAPALARAVEAARTEVGA